MKRFAKAAAILALALLVIFITASLLVRFYFPAEKVKEFIASEAANALGRDVSIGDVSLSIFRGIDIHDIYIGEDRGIGAIPFIKVRKVSAGYSLSEIFRKKIVFKRVSIEGPEVYIRSRKGELALSGLIKRTPPEKKDGKPFPVTLVLQRGEVKGLNLFYEAEDAKVAVKGIDVGMEGDIYPFRNIDIRVSSRGKENIDILIKELALKSGLLTDLRLGVKDAEKLFVSGDLSMRGVKTGIKNKELLPFDAAVEIDLAGNLSGGAEMKRLSLAVGKGSNINIHGSLKGLKGFSGLEMESDGEFELSELSMIASNFLSIPVRGSVKIDALQVSGVDLRSLALKAQLSLKKVTASHRGFTLPLEGRINAEANGRGDISVSSLKMASGDAIRVEMSAKASEWGKGKVEGKGEVRADNARVFAMMSDDLLKKIGKIDLSGETAIEISGVRVSDKKPIRGKISGKTLVNDLRMEDVQAEGLAATFSASSDDLIRGRAAIDAELDIKGISYRKGELALKEDSLKGALSASGNFKKGELALKRIEVSIPELLKMALDGDIKGWGKDLALNAKIEDMDYKGLMDRLPPTMKQRLLKMDAEGKGALSMSVIGDINPGGKGLMEKVMGVNIAGTFKSEGVGVHVPEKGVRIRDSKGYIEFDISPAVQWISGTIKVGRLEKEGLLEDHVEASVDFEMLADGPDIKVKNISLKVPPKAVSVSVSGDVKNYSRGPQPNLDMAFSFDSPKKVTILKGIDASGRVSFEGAVKSDRDKEFELKGDLRFDSLAASYQGRAEVRDLNGEINISQGIRYDGGVELMTGNGKRGMDMPHASSLSGLLRPYTREYYDLTLASASFDGYEVGPASMDIAWENGNLMIDRYDMALFRGGVTGRMQVAYNKGVPEYSVSSSLAGVRLDSFFKDMKGGEDVEINANLDIRGRGTEIDGDINVTRIGKDILDRALLRLDPGESNPQIVDIRRKLKTLGWVPKEVSMWIRHGELNMDITLQRKTFTLLNIVGLQKIPVRRIPVSYLIKKVLKRGD